MSDRLAAVLVVFGMPSAPAACCLKRRWQQWNHPLVAITAWMCPQQASWTGQCRAVMCSSCVLFGSGAPDTQQDQLHRPLHRGCTLYLGGQHHKAKTGRATTAAAQRFGVNLCGQHGEYHTLVWDAPLMQAPLRLVAEGHRVVESDGCPGTLMWSGSLCSSLAMVGRGITAQRLLMGHPGELIHCETALNSILHTNLASFIHRERVFWFARPPREILLCAFCFD